MAKSPGQRALANPLLLSKLQSLSVPELTYGGANVL
jgi:hypothetical protein